VPEATKAAGRVKSPSAIRRPATSSTMPAKAPGLSSARPAPAIWPSGKPRNFWVPCSRKISPETILSKARAWSAQGVILEVSAMMILRSCGAFRERSRARRLFGPDRVRSNRHAQLLDSDDADRIACGKGFLQPLVEQRILVPGALPLPGPGRSWALAGSFCLLFHGTFLARLCSMNDPGTARIRGARPLRRRSARPGRKARSGTSAAPLHFRLEPAAGGTPSASAVPLERGVRLPWLLPPTERLAGPSIRCTR
jgi:hypothetical protein